MADGKQVRLDKWLWAARFYKTRALAANAVTAGRVKVNGVRTKPSKQLNVDDKINIQLIPVSWDIQVKELSNQRVAADLAKNFYEESDESQAQRNTLTETLKLAKQLQTPNYGSRPTKRGRQQIIRFKQNKS
ncbi:MAG: S4 domain-containing protein [Proteobacteria bacterium]|nr:S4 domain-containing protein [Pseudomonadota bacterium]MDA1331154.1 S4 domain-containing protein [Pseudomonadota bacterium]